MPSDHEILLSLARTLDVDKTVEELGIDRDSLRELLKQLAIALEEDSADAASGHELHEGPANQQVEGTLTIHIDGASRGNPGEAGAGVYISQDGKMIEGEARYLGRMTNNQAEYNALIIGLERARALGASGVGVMTDSELVAHQMNGVYKVKNPQMKKLFEKAKELADSFQKFSIRHVRREQNKEADRLANRAIDEFKDPT